MPFILTLAKMIGEAIVSLVNSQVGRLAIVAMLAYGYGHHRASVAYEAHEAQARAELEDAHARELAREREAAQHIAAEAARRAHDNEDLAESLQAKIDEFSNSEKGTAHETKIDRTNGGCDVDDAFARGVRSLDDAAARAPTPPRRPRKFR